MDFVKIMERLTELLPKFYKDELSEAELKEFNKLKYMHDIITDIYILYGDSVHTYEKVKIF